MGVSDQRSETSLEKADANQIGKVGSLLSFQRDERIYFILLVRGENN